MHIRVIFKPVAAHCMVLRRQFDRDYVLEPSIQRLLDTITVVRACFNEKVGQMLAKIVYVRGPLRASSWAGPRGRRPRLSEPADSPVDALFSGSVLQMELSRKSEPRLPGDPRVREPLE